MKQRMNLRHRHLILAVTLYAGIFSSVSASEIVKVSTIDNYVQRVSLDVMSEAYSRIGMKMDVMFMPGKRALQASNAGKTQAELSRIDGMSKKFPNLVKVPVQINLIEASVFTIDETFEIDGWPSLKPFSIGIRRGTAFAENGTKGMKNMPVNSEEQLIEVLLADRVDVVVTGQLNGLIAIKQLGATTVTEMKPVLQSYPLFHYVHKSQAYLVPKLTKVLEEMQSEGVIERIRADAKARLLAS